MTDTWEQEFISENGMAFLMRYHWHDFVAWREMWLAYTNALVSSGLIEESERDDMSCPMLNAAEWLEFAQDQEWGIS